MTAPDDNRAMTRFFTIVTPRLGGLAIAALGAWMWRDAANTGTDGILGRALVVGGLFVALVVPALLARRWRRDA